MTTTRFLKVICKCKNEQVVFNKSANSVKCLVCGEELVKSRGGKAKIKSKVIGEMK